MKDNSHKALQNKFSTAIQGIRSYSIDKKDDFYKVVCGPAYKDFTPRNQAKTTKSDVKGTLDGLANKLYDFIHNGVIETEEDYDKWHDSVCLEFVEQYNQNGKSTIKYGKAQKIVNMSLKYIYCFDDSKKYREKFCHCHMPIDRYTLEWFCRYVVKELNAKKEEKEKLDRISVTKIRDTSWSSLDAGKEMYQYSWIQKQIRDFLVDGHDSDYLNLDGQPLTPFEAEFYIWPEMQLHLAAEDFLFQLKPVDSGKKKEIKEKALKEKLDEVANALKGYCL